MRFPRTVQLDISDSHVYDAAAAPDEWAVSGSFVFAGADPESLIGKRRQAFARAFLGTSSFGWSTFVRVAEIQDEEYQGVLHALAIYAVERFGAPDIETALPAAREEAEFAAGLCDHKVNTLLCVERDFEDGDIIERFRTVEPPREAAHARIWTIVEDDGSV
ncbi:MAG: hypothetical protein GY791_16155 [Alphaproteobacteria bacterium]|nr:hypothetical protein [Alphaproteobacteria bacterium]